MTRQKLQLLYTLRTRGEHAKCDAPQPPKRAAIAARTLTTLPSHNRNNTLQRAAFQQLHSSAAQQ